MNSMPFVRFIYGCQYIDNEASVTFIDCCGWHGTVKGEKKPNIDWKKTLQRKINVAARLKQVPLTKQHEYLTSSRRSTVRRPVAVWCRLPSFVCTDVIAWFVGVTSPTRTKVKNHKACSSHALWENVTLNSWSNGCPTLVCLLQLTFYAQNVGGSLTLHADTVPSNTLHRDLWCYTWATDDWSFTLSQSVVLHTSPRIASGVCACACMLACVCV